MFSHPLSLISLLSLLNVASKYYVRLTSYHLLMFLSCFQCVIMFLSFYYHVLIVFILCFRCVIMFLSCLYVLMFLSCFMLLCFYYFFFFFFLRFCFFDARINPFTHHFHQNNTDVILGSLLTLSTGKSLLFWLQCLLLRLLFLTFKSDH